MLSDHTENKVMFFMLCNATKCGICYVLKRIIHFFNLPKFCLTFSQRFPSWGIKGWCYFFESTRCLVGCLVITQQQTEHIYMYLAIKCKAVFAVSTASLFLDFCFIAMKHHYQKKKKPLLFSSDSPVCFCWCFAVSPFSRDAKLLE